MNSLSALLMLCLTSPMAADLDREVEALRQAQWDASLDATDYAPSPYTRVEQLPSVLAIETHYQGFNDYYYFALVDGRIYYKPRFKRPGGQADWEVELPWKPFGHNGGLPYRLDHRKPAKVDSTYADGDRNGFVSELHFLSAEQTQWSQYIDAEGWSEAGEWQDQAVPLSEDFPVVERILALTADADEIAVLSESRQMFYRRKFANIFVNTEWYQGWGQAKELQVFFPEHLSGHRGWSLGRITANGVGYKEGPDGRVFEWGPAAVSMETMVWLSPTGRKIYYLDSGTPPEVVHFVEAPFRGQYQGEGINSSASTVMLIDRYGAVQTKIADFDLLGSTPTHPYCYMEECDDEPFYEPGDIRSGMSDIRLPAEGWQIHAPVLAPAQWDADTYITSRITVLQTGKGNAARELRVVGAQDGVLGYYYKEIQAQTWSFRAAPEGDLGFVGDASQRLKQEDLSLWQPGADLGAMHQREPVLDQELIGLLQLNQDITLALQVEDFNLEASPWQAHLRWREVDLPLEVHVVQAWNPFLVPHSAEGSPELFTYEATLVFDRQALEKAMAQGEASSPEGLAVRRMLTETKNAKFALVINATHEGFEVRPKAWRRVGGGFAVAMLPELAPQAADVTQFLEAFWARQEGHMGWSAEVEALQASAQCQGTWAAEVVELHERVNAEEKALRKAWRGARRYSRAIFVTSGLMYVSQAKSIDAALDNRREWRGTEVRPNELRFNVITGVTSRIPYLAANISKVQRQRHAAAKSEKGEIQAPLKALLKQAEDCP